MSSWKEFKKNQGVTRPWDFLNPTTEFADEDLEKSRYSICQDCPEFIKLTSQCKQCGCIMKVKVKLRNARCPLAKW